jgi:hypothetical protein
MGAWEDPTTEAFTKKRKAAEAHAHNYCLAETTGMGLGPKTYHWLCACGSRMKTGYDPASNTAQDLYNG